MQVNDPIALAELGSAFEAYEAALMSNDVKTLDGLFWKSPHTVRYGVGENLYGAEEILAFRRQRRGGSPQRRLTRTVITTFGNAFGVTSAEFVREGGTRIGRQSQTWVRLAEGWRIVAAHVSLMGEGS